MNWKWGVAFGVMAFITLVSIVYSFVQTVKAEAAERDALTQKELTENAIMEAYRQRKLATEKDSLYRKTFVELDDLKKLMKK